MHLPTDAIKIIGANLKFTELMKLALTSRSLFQILINLKQA